MGALLAIGWEPELRGLLIVIIAVGVLCGSVYLILATNIGIRLGFLIAFAGLFGWMATMGAIWWAYGIGLKGREPTWEPVEGKTIIQDPSGFVEIGILDTPVEVADDGLFTDDAVAVGEALQSAGWEALPTSSGAFGQAASSAGALIEEDGQVGAGQYQVVSIFDKGGDRWPKITDEIDFTAFFHKPHHVIAEVAPLVAQRAEPGRAPARAEIDETQPRRYVYMIRDLGSRRQPAAVLTVGGGTIFLICCWLLHRRDLYVIANRRSKEPLAGSTSAARV